MINISVDKASIERIKTALGDLSRRMPRELATAINATAKKVRFEAAKELKKSLKVPVRILKKVIATKSKAKADSLQAVIGLWEGHPIPLKYFGAKQIKRGVTYKIDPRLKGKSVLRDAFIPTQYGGRVYRRKGKARGPLEQVYGPKPGDVFAQTDLIAKATAVARTELPKQIERRIRFLTLKASGGLRGNQK